MSRHYDSRGVSILQRWKVTERKASDGRIVNQRVASPFTSVDDDPREWLHSRNSAAVSVFRYLSPRGLPRWATAEFIRIRSNSLALSLPDIWQALSRSETRLARGKLLVRAYCVGFLCIRPHANFPRIWRLLKREREIHVERGGGRETERASERERERKREREKERARGSTTRHTSKSCIYILARRRHLHSRTNTDKHARPIYSTALFPTASRHGSPFHATIVLLVRRSRASWLTTLSRTLVEEKQKRRIPRTCACVCVRARAPTVSCRRYRVRLRCRDEDDDDDDDDNDNDEGVNGNNAPRSRRWRRDLAGARRDVTLRSRRWHRYPVLEEIAAA